MKIAFMAPPWCRMIPPVRAGAVAMDLYELARRTAKFADVTVYSRMGPGDPAEQVYDGVTYRRMDVSADQRSAKFLGPLRRLVGVRSPMFTSPRYYRRYIEWAANDAAARGCEIIEVAYLLTFMPALRRRNPDAKLVLTMGSEWVVQLDREWVGKTLDGVDCIVSIARYLTDETGKRFPKLAPRCRTINVAMDMDLWPATGVRPAGDGQTAKVLYVGRLSPEKGVHLLLDAFIRHVLPHAPRASLQIVGSEQVAPPDFLLNVSDDPAVRALAPWYVGSYEAKLRRMAAQAPQGRIAFSGFVQHDRLPDIYRSADIVAVPSFTETFSHAICEAMACEVAAVATRVGGSGEIIEHERTGLLVEGGDAAGLGAAILRLIREPQLRAALAQAGRRHALEALSWDRIAEQRRALYEELAREQRPASVAQERRRTNSPVAERTA